MRDKRANESVGMSVNVIFSIFLIVVFISVAFVAINFFLKMNNSGQIGNFYEDFQEEIDNAWASSGTSKTFEVDLSNKIEYLCFMDSESSGRGIWEESYGNFSVYSFGGANFFVYPLSAAGDLKSKEVKHLNISQITHENNPYCIQNPSTIQITKDVYSQLVEIS
jgi:hypothetical protein